MKATIRSTDTIVKSVPSPTGPRIVPARVWEGVTENGVEFVAYITCVQVKSTANGDEFERDLKEHSNASESTQRAIELRHIL